MKRLFVTLLVGLPLVVLVVWIARHTDWDDTTVAMPAKGEAATNQFYAAQRFAEALGARTRRDHVLVLPPTTAVIVVSSWHWSLSHGRREALERWVAAGGRLVVDQTLIDSVAEFEDWSGITREWARPSDGHKPDGWQLGDRCWTSTEESAATETPASSGASYQICNFEWVSHLASENNVAWALRDASGIHAIRTRVGRGTVTMIDAAPFTRRNLLDGDHGRLFVAATALRRGDEVHFLSEDDATWLLALAWQRGAPVIAFALAMVALALWRGAIRFGPLAAPPVVARRSLAEQIRGTGRFALRHGGGESLHGACVRALEEAARRRVKAYATLSGGERATALAEITGLNRNALGSAVHQRPDGRTSSELRRAIALIEAARRRLLADRTPRAHMRGDSAAPSHREQV
jgi:hypothetical protein